MPESKLSGSSRADLSRYVARKFAEHLDADIAQLLRESNNGDAVGHQSARREDWRCDDCKPCNGFSIIEAVTCNARALDCAQPRCKCRWSIPFQQREGAAQFCRTQRRECCNASASSTRQCGRARPDLNGNRAILSARGGHDNKMAAGNDFDRHRQHLKLLRHADQFRLRACDEAVASENGRGDSQHAGIKRVSLGGAVEGDQFFLDQDAQNVKAGAGYQPQPFGYFADAHRSAGLAQESQHRNTARQRRDLLQCAKNRVARSSGVFRFVFGISYHRSNLGCADPGEKSQLLQQQVYFNVLWFAVLRRHNAARSGITS